MLYGNDIDSASDIIPVVISSIPLEPVFTGQCKILLMRKNISS